MKSNTLAIALLTALCVPLLAACRGVAQAQQPLPTLPPVVDSSEVTVEGRLEPAHFTQIAPSTSGLVSEVLFHEGDQVAAGQVIVRLQDARAQTLEAAQASAAQELAEAYQAVHDAQEALDAYPLPRIFVGMTAEQATSVWLDKLQRARTDFAPYKETSRKHWKKNRRFDIVPIFPDLPRIILFDTNQYERVAKEYKKTLDIAWVNYRKACDWLALDADLQSAKARLLEAQRRNIALQDASLTIQSAGIRGALASAEIRAPFAGTITNLDLKAGEYAQAGKTVLTIADLSAWVVKTTELTEIDVVSASEGQPVTVTLDALPDVTFKGKVLSISQNYSLRQDDIVYEATILLDDQHPAMRWGLTAQVTFLQ